ncbi:Rha family transcriptional regulator [Paenibacillus larvae]|uniref:Rha family transcriptional regulator n=1 Tax=Paenibacillus larvae TaxID=1464 RepID=UPI000169551A|nr:Rha family transcriptional regulator [Paenibacillus larvae]ETK27411.1 SPBc2 prophage-derived putative antirepressor protein YoqD [Paenibacillus larvae subsp. larvae DSM 25719]MDT2268141.1 Rha family transcriptional regulator [Paenibacillus larvae]MDT2288971.1 Rha family transcriptional regulator [Paenibacillus larvae]MDT2295573.1 Rha family transcriptional regulator [Paenibacillus larvae]MDT2306295.1 Rha family transcriptional regulator [Paenibacillus larvae]
MNQLNVINRNGQLLVDSREVAEMIGKQHGHLLRDIDSYKNVLTESNYGVSEFFLEHSYQDRTGRKLKCYLLTRKGCDMVANKMTGGKGVLFTAEYVTRFEEMEHKLTKPPQTSLEILQASINQLVDQERRLAEHDARIEAVDQDVKSIREVVALNVTNWRKDASDLIKRTAQAMGGYEHIRHLREESYRLLDETLGVSLATRLTNKRRRMADEGVCKSKRDKLNYLDIIADDKKLIHSYVAIVKDIAIKYGGLRQDDVS